MVGRMVEVSSRTRLPNVPSLTRILPRGAEGGIEFARIVDLLILHQYRRENGRFNMFDDSAGDFFGMDSFGETYFRKVERTGYQYKFIGCPINPKHRTDIERSILRATSSENKSQIQKYVLVLPEDLTESQSRSSGDVSWFENLKTKLNTSIELEAWGHKRLVSLLLEAEPLCIRYYPELLVRGRERKRGLDGIAKSYFASLGRALGRIEFVGMSVYKEEATKGIPIEKSIYHYL